MSNPSVTAGARPTTTDLRLVVRGLAPADADRLAATLAKVARNLGGSLSLTDHGVLDSGLVVKTGTRKIV